MTALGAGPALVAVHTHRSVSLVVPGASGVGAVDGDLLVISTQSVPVGVRIREQTTLQKNNKKTTTNNNNNNNTNNFQHKRDEISNNLVLLYPKF